MFLPSKEWHIYSLAYVVHICASVVNMVYISIHPTIVFITFTFLELSLGIRIYFSLHNHAAVIRAKVIFYSIIGCYAWKIFCLSLYWLMAIKTNRIHIYHKSLVEKCIAIHNQSIYSTTFSWFCKPLHSASFSNSFFSIFSRHIFSAKIILVQKRSSSSLPHIYIRVFFKFFISFVIKNTNPPVFQ